MRQPLLALVTALGLGACSEPTPGSDVPAERRARASVITSEAELIGGPKASGRVGDFLLRNARVRFVIGALRPRSWVPVGGSLLDADRVREGGGGDDRLQEMVTRIGSLSVLAAEKVEIIADGGDGRAAVVRVTGHDIPVPILQSVAPTPPANVDAITDYRLEPDRDSLEITTTITDTSGAAHTVPAGDLFILGDGVTLFVPTIGSDESKLTFATGLRFFSAFGGQVSYGYQAPGRKLTLLVPQSEIFGAGTDTLNVTAGGSATFTRDLVVGEGDVAALLPEIVRREGGDPAKLVTVEGTVSEAQTKAPIAGASLVLSDGKGPYAAVVAGKDGAFRAPVEPGKYEYSATAAGHPGSAKGTIDAAAGAPSPVAVTLADTGRFALQIRDDRDRPSPARVQLRGMDGSAWGTVLSADGEGGGVLPPGSYLAVASRGYEWEAASVPFTVAAGMTAMVPIQLARVVDTTGYVAIDSHEHTAASVDSQLDPRIRVAQALADGVELVITTEHDVLFDIGKVAAGMKLAAPFTSVVGCEISPVPGHINGYPAAIGPDSDSDGYWPAKWWSEDADHVFTAVLWPKDIFAAIRKKLGSKVVQINHPRSSSQGVLNWVGYDTARGLASVDPARFDMSWDVLEVCNSGCDQDPGSEDSKTLRDWFSFLKQGFIRGAVGVSDAHSEGPLLGRARTLVRVHDDDPANLATSGAIDEVWSSLPAGRSMVQDGAFVVASVLDDGGKQVEMGGLAKASGQQITLHVKVQAPSWIPTDRVRVIQNGVEVKVVPIPAMMLKTVVRFDADILLDAPAGDAFYVVIVDGDALMAPVIAARPRSITNAVFVDRNGNGKFDAPGL